MTSRLKGLVLECNLSKSNKLLCQEDIEIVAHYKEDHSAKTLTVLSFKTF